MKDHPRMFLRNMFRNSFHWSPDTREVFVRIERTRNPGQLTVLLTHVLAHIRCEHWADDDPRFVAAFTESMQHICSEFFYVRLKRSGVSDELQDSNILNFREAFHLMPSLSVDSKSTVLQELMDLVREGSLGGGGSISAKNLFSRLNQFETFARNSKLKTHLADLENELSNKVQALQNESKARTATVEPIRVKLDQRIEYLYSLSDELNVELSTKVFDMQRIAETLVQLESTGASEDEIADKRAALDKLIQLKDGLLQQLNSLDTRRTRIEVLKKELD
jgi:hypothetical protein